MLNITEIADELHEVTAWQDTPVPLTSEDYTKIVKRAVRNFFVDINRASEYSKEKFIQVDDSICYDRDFMADEEVYIIILCKIEFFERVQTDVNNAFGYTTNALTVTNADKPYKNLAETLSNLYNERRIKFNKMVRYTLGE